MNSATNRPDNISAGLTTVNGVESSTLAVADRGTSYGHGLFETMLLSASAVPLWQYHRARLVNDAPKLGLPVDDRSLNDNLERFLELLAQRSITKGIIKITLTAGPGGRGYAAPQPLSPQIICQFSPLPENLLLPRQEGVALIQCQYSLPSNPILAGIKHLNRLDQVLAAAEIKPQGTQYADGIMFSQDSILWKPPAPIYLLKPLNWAGSLRSWIRPAYAVLCVHY